MINKQLLKLEKYLINNNNSFKKNHTIKYDTYFKMGGNVKYFLTPQSFNEFQNIIKYLLDEDFDYKVIGFTSNIILLDEIEYSILISTKNLTKVEIHKDIIQVETGYSVQDLVRIAVMNQSKGFEGLEGIPASIGGAIFMNAGAYGDTISDNLISVECIDKNNEYIILQKDDCNFTYRNSIFKSENFIILRASFKFKNGKEEEIAKKIETFHIARHSYQDFVYPNLGSMISLTGGDIYNKILKNNFLYHGIYWTLKYIYKNPITKFINRKRPNNNIFNSLLVNYLGKKKNIKLKYTLSAKSANILINDGTTTSKEIIEYIYLMHDLIDKQFHIENEIVLEPTFSIKKSFEDDYNIILKQKRIGFENSINNNSQCK